MAGKDLLGNDLTTAEQRVLEAYQTLQGLLDEDLAPMAEANVREAISALWQVVNNLALSDERPDA